MEYLVEAAVGHYLSCNGKAFVCSNYHIPYDVKTSEGGADPDFVVLDFTAKEVVVVEVTTASSVANLLSRVRERRTRWFSPLIRRLTAEGHDCWPWTRVRFMGFVRKDLVQEMSRAIPDDDVTFCAIEDAILAYNYWEHRCRGLPDNAKKELVG